VKPVRAAQPARVDVDAEERVRVGKKKYRYARGTCSLCGQSKRVNGAGLLRLHEHNGATCDGSAKPPRVKPTPTGWRSVRRAALVRDEYSCRKCGRPNELEVHHIKERTFGGGDELENLITLCHDCHCEWTFCEMAIPFEQWRRLPPAKLIVPLLVHDWPENVSAGAFQQQLYNAIALVLYERNEKLREASAK
jgi:hypothetical protein